MEKYDSDWVKKYYDEYGEKEWERWDASPVEQIKFEVHLYYLRKYLTTSDRILEIGAGFAPALSSLATARVATT